MEKPGPTSPKQETDAASQLQLLQTRLTRMEQRLQGEEQRRKVAEERPPKHRVRDRSEEGGAS
jgi:hypothetical protein